MPAPQLEPMRRNKSATILVHALQFELRLECMRYDLSATT